MIYHQSCNNKCHQAAPLCIGLTIYIALLFMHVKLMYVSAFMHTVTHTKATKKKQRYLDCSSS